MKLAGVAAVLTVLVAAQACEDRAAAPQPAPTAVTTAPPATTSPPATTTAPATSTPRAEPSVSAITAAAAAAFVDYAQGAKPAVPWAGVVAYTITGEQVAGFDAAFADRRDSWEGCPAGLTTYEGRDCPVSPLRTLRRLDENAEVVLEPTAPRIFGCNRYRAPEAGAATTVWLRPDERLRSCFSDFAIAVSLDAAGRVLAVDLALSGP